jgi:hypothetical protein
MKEPKSNQEAWDSCDYENCAGPIYCAVVAVLPIYREAVRGLFHDRKEFGSEQKCQRTVAKEWMQQSGTTASHGTKRQS